MCKNIEQKTTFEKALEVFGGYNQMIKTTEEMAELTKELCKAFIGQEDRLHILEEITDVEIMLKQMKIYYNFTDDEKMTMLCKKVAKLEMYIQEQEKKEPEKVYIKKCIE